MMCGRGTRAGDLVRLEGHPDGLVSDALRWIARVWLSDADSTAQTGCVVACAADGFGRGALLHAVDNSHTTRNLGEEPRIPRRPAEGRVGPDPCVGAGHSVDQVSERGHRESLSENNRKQAVYAARRRSWTEAQLRRNTPPEPEPPQAQPESHTTVPARSPRLRSSVIHDKRQLSRTA